MSASILIKWGADGGSEGGGVKGDGGGDDGDGGGGEGDGGGGDGDGITWQRHCHRLLATVGWPHAAVLATVLKLS